MGFYTRAYKNSGRSDVKVLNLFAYTGAATVACLKEGASVVHVDASKGMTQWAKENAQASGVADGDVRWIVDDCMKFVKREIRRENNYDIIILDPPSYGRGPKGEIWHLEDSLYDFMVTVEQVLSDNPIAVILNSYTTGLSASVMKYILDDVVTKSAAAQQLPTKSVCRFHQTEAFFRAAQPQFGLRKISNNKEKLLCL